MGAGLVENTGPVLEAGDGSWPPLGWRSATPEIQPVPYLIDGVGLFRHLDAAAERERHKCQWPDAVGETEVAVAAGPVSGGPIVGRVAGPPAGQRLVSDRDWPDEAHEVGEHLSQQVAGGIPRQEVGAKAGEAANEVVLPQCRELAAVDACVGMFEASAGDGGDVAVEGVERRGVRGATGRARRRRRECLETWSTPREGP